MVPSLIWGHHASLRHPMLHPRGRTSPRIPLPREGKRKVIASIYQHPISGLRRAVSLGGPVDHSLTHRGLRRAVSCEGDVLQTLKVR